MFVLRTANTTYFEENTLESLISSFDEQVQTRTGYNHTQPQLKKSISVFGITLKREQDPEKSMLEWENHIHKSGHIRHLLVFHIVYFFSSI